MADVQKLKKRAAELEQRRQFDRALELYIQLLDEAGRDLHDQDVPLFNRVGDMLIRKGDVSGALAYYERAVDAYAERGFLNNAIALCNKILRQSPGRTAVYYKLGKISARKGFKSDARKAFLEYADRMQKVGHLDEAFRALKEFAALYPDQDDVRLILADLLSRENRKGEALEQLQALYEKLEAEGREVEARATVDRMKAIDPNVTPRATGAAPAPVAGDLVFLDLTLDEPPRRATPRSSAAASPATGDASSAQGPLVPALDGLAITFVPDDEPPAPSRLPGLEPTIIDAAAYGASPMPGAAESTGLDEVAEVELLDLVEPATDAASDEANGAVELEGLEATTFALVEDPAVGGGEREAEPVVQTDTALLSEIEFAELDLADAAPPVEARAHDLALPSVLPLLSIDVPGGEVSLDSAMGGGEAADDGLEVLPEIAVAEGEPPAGLAGAGVGGVMPAVGAVEERDGPAGRVGTPAVLAAVGAVVDAAASNDGGAEAGFASAAADLPNAGPPADVSESSPSDETGRLARAEPGAVVPAAERPSSDVALGGTEEGAEWPRETMGLDSAGTAGALPADGEAAVPAEDGAGVGADDFLSQPPRFGGASTSGAHAFPPLPGFSYSLSVEDASAEAPDAGESRDAEPVSVPLDAAAAGAARAEANLEAPETSGPDAPVDAPLPAGFEEASSESGSDATAHVPTPRRGTGVVGTPRLAPSIGRDEAQLRRRLELEPEHWGLRRQLGEALLDAGDRDAGLYELELTMAGLELSSDLARAQEILDVILRVMPGSVRHHQKRVEFAVRAHDHRRLVDAYLELADALFRTGEAAKAADVYHRVAELDPGNERAEFALATLPGSGGGAGAEGVVRAHRFSDEMAVIDTGAPLPATPAVPPRAVTAPQPVVAAADDEAIGQATADRPFLAETLDAPVAEEDDGAAGGTVPSGEVRHEYPAAPAAGMPADGNLDDDVAPSRASQLLEGIEVVVGPDSAPEPEATTNVELPQAQEATDDARDALSSEGAVPSAVEASDAVDPEARAPRDTILDRARRLTPAAGVDADFVDLGEWLRLTEPVKNTRMVVDETPPTGDEQADFEEMLRRFKRGVAESVDAEDFEAHYDLGVAYKEMGLVDEAIAEFQKALRGSGHRVRAYEALGQCFVEKGQYSIAAALLQRGVDTPGTDDDVLVGVLYLLGFASEQMGRHGDALRYYQRVFAVDIEFRDVAQRVAALELLTK